MMPRTQQIAWLALPLLLWGQSLAVMAYEFKDEDIFPYVQKIVFSEKAVGFAAAKSRVAGAPKLYFVLQRNSRVFKEVNAQRFTSIFPDRGGPKARDSDYRRIILRASDGTEFRHWSAYCSENGVGHNKKLAKDKKLIPTHIDICNSIIALEVIGDRLWLGTYRAGEGGHYPGEGVVVQTLDGSKLIKSQSVAGAVNMLRLDPFSDRVWVTTRLGIFEMDRNASVVSEGYFYYDFDLPTGQPVLLLVPSIQKSNLLAVVARGLGLAKADEKAFYEAAKSIPKEVIDSFPFYAYFMSLQPFPKEWNVLVPFYIKAVKSAPANTKYGDYIMLCRFDDQRVADFLLEEAKDYDRNSEGALLNCLRKYGFEKEAEEAAIQHREIQEQRRKTRADSEFGRLTANYFIELRREVYEIHYRTMKDLCQLVVRNPDYVERLVAVFAERGVKIPRDSNFFVHCLGVHMDHKGFDQFLPVLIEGLKAKEAGLVLQSSCDSLRGLPQERLSEAVVPVLRARTSARLYKKRYDAYAINPYLDVYISCAKASHWVLGQNDRIDTLLKELKDHPEIQSAAFDTLHELTGENFRTVDEWQNWWAGHGKLKHQ
jgi:hypothetical protein